jgi:NADPH:quinone reductase-like Zn-dependent oxidoreductase
MTGSVAHGWAINSFSPMGQIPHTVYLTSYHGSEDAFMAMPFAHLCELVASGKLPIKTAKIFKLDDIVAAHRCLEDSQAAGKIVVLP